MKNIIFLISGSLVFLAASAALTQTYPPEFYPTVDEVDHWTVGEFSDGEIRYVDKKIRTSATTTENRRVFYSIKFLKLYAANESKTYTLTHLNEYTYEIPDFYKKCYGWYNVDGTSWRVYIAYRLWLNGQIDILASWTNWPANHADYYFVFDVDYDLAGAADDIVEYQITENNVQQWYARPDAGWTNPYFGTLVTSNPGPLDGNWLVRCADATSPGNQLQLFWGSVYDTYSWHYFYLRTYGASTGAIQDVYDNNYYQQYAYGGRDQKMEIWIGTNSGTPNPDNLYYKSVSGKLFQKPNGRSLEIHTIVMQGAATPNLNLTVDNGRSVANALNDLTNYKWGNYTRANVPDPYAATPDYKMTWSQLHDFMTSNRRYYSPIYVCDDQALMREWKVEVDIVNHKLNPGALGVMFDYLGSFNSSNPPGADLNNIEREGVAISWPTAAYWATQNTRYSAEQFLAFTFIHEMGHCFNMQHEWSGCGEDYNTWNCSKYDNPTIMAYGPMRAGGQTTMRWSDDNLDWYQNGPESWVKPGRFGTLWCDYYQYVPDFLRY